MAGILGHPLVPALLGFLRQESCREDSAVGRRVRGCPSILQNPHRSSLRIWLRFLEYADPTDLPGTLQVTILVKGAGSCWTIKSNEALIYITTWMSLEIIMLSKGS